MTLYYMFLNRPFYPTLKFENIPKMRKCYNALILSSAKATFKKSKVSQNNWFKHTFFYFRWNHRYVSLKVLNQNLDNDLFLIDSLKLQLGYEYNLNDVKEIQVTDSFLSLDESKRKCQNKETNKVKISLLSLRLTSWFFRNVCQRCIRSVL